MVFDPPVSAVVLAVADLPPLEALSAAALEPSRRATRGLRPPLVVVPLAVARHEVPGEADVALAQRAEPLGRVVVERAAREVHGVLRRNIVITPDRDKCLLLDQENKKTQKIF